MFRCNIFRWNLLHWNIEQEVSDEMDKKPLFTMKMEETDKGIAITCEGELCKDFVEKMKKGEIKLGHYSCCCPPTVMCCVPTKKEE